MLNWSRADALVVNDQTVDQQLLQKIKQVSREIKNGIPGQRFVDYYQRTRRREPGHQSFWRTFGYVTVGLMLVVCGLLLSLPPGLPGFLLWIPGFALLSARSKPLAMLLDRLEVWGRRLWKKHLSRS